jgi:transposase
LQPAKKRGVPGCIGRTKGGLNSKLHAVVDGQGRPVRLHLTAGQVSDYEGARTFLPDLPAAKFLLADKGYDANWFRDGLIGKGIWPCIPPKKNRKYRVSFDKTIYKQRHKIENMFRRLKVWRRIATRFDRCAHTFFSAICIAATVIWWL